MNAFGGKHAIKDGLLRDLRNPAHFEGSRLREERILAWSKAGILPESIFWIVSHIADGDGSGNQSLIISMIEMIEPGADLSTLPHTWLAAMLEPLLVLLRDPEPRGSAATVIALHGRAARGDSVGRAEWRGGRASIGRYDDQASDAGKVLAIVAASCWNMTSVPGAMRDTLDAWRVLLFDIARRAESWTDDDQAALAEVMKGVRATVEAQVGNRPDADTDPEGFAVYQEQFRRIFQESLARNKHPLCVRWRRLMERVTVSTGELHGLGRAFYAEIVQRLPLSAESGYVRPDLP